MMLWKKESNKKDAPYIDLLALCETDMESDINQIIAIKGSKPIPQKSNAIAVQKRRDGNAVYGVHAYGHAMELYSESLCYSESGSENISLAYANRSSCFLNMNMIDECLKDIELAKEAGYPMKLMHKLDERRVTCLKRIADGVQPYVIDAKLSFKHDKKFPCMANVLKVKRDNMGNYSVVAKEDIDVDQTIVMEKSFRTHLSKRFGFKCNICLKGYTNLVPCKKCAVAMFCEDCQNHFLHEYECGLNICGPSAFNNDVMYTVRDILLTISMFSSIDELMDFVEEIMNNDLNVLPESLKNPQSKYEILFKSALRCEPDSIDSMAFWIYPISTTILKIPQIKAMFQSEKQLRFLQHLISHHSLTSVSNARFGAPTIQTVDEEFEDPMMFCCYVNVMDRYFQHSCAPNVLTIAGDGRSVFVTAKPIKQGEQLFISHIPICIEPTDYRQEFLWEQVNMRCSCSRCKGVEATAIERLKLTSHPSFHFIMTHKKSPQISSATYKEIEEAIQHCVTLLDKYGRMKWCDELMAIIGKYQALLNIRVAGNTHNPKCNAKLLQAQLI